MKRTLTRFPALDDVYQGPGEPGEDRSGGFDKVGSSNLDRAAQTRRGKESNVSRMILVSLALLLVPACAASGPPLRPAVEAHLRAIASRDLDALVPTITNGTDLQMIAPDGYRYTTRQQYVEFHRNWFTIPDGGKLDAEVVHVTAGADIGHALIRYRYRSNDTTGTEREITSWLALTFALEEGRWRLVFDQNTLIANPAAR